MPIYGKWLFVNFFFVFPLDLVLTKSRPINLVLQNMYKDVCKLRKEESIRERERERKWLAKVVV